MNERPQNGNKSITFSQEITGRGWPVAWQLKTTDDPFLTVWSTGFSFIFGMV